MELQPGEFLDDPDSLLDPSHIPYQSSEEWDSDASSDLSPSHPDCHLRFITYHPNDHPWILHGLHAPPPPVEHRVKMYHDTVENEQYVWSVPGDTVHIPVGRPRLTIVLSDYKERFRIDVPVHQLTQDIHTLHYIVRFSTKTVNNMLVIDDVVLRSPLHRPPLDARPQNGYNTTQSCCLR